MASNALTINDPSRDLVSLARHNSPENRRDLLRAIIDVFLANPQHFSEAELRHFDVIIHRLIEINNAAGIDDALTPEARTYLFFQPLPTVRKQIMTDAQGIGEKTIQQAILVNRKQTLLTLKRNAGRHAALADHFIEERIKIGAINESLLKTLIAEKRNTEFLFAFSYFVGVDPTAGRTILRDPWFVALAIACKTAGLERETFAKIVFGLQRHAKGGTGVNFADQANALKVLDLHVKTPPEIAEKLMRFWRVDALRRRGTLAPQASAPEAPAAKDETGSMLDLNTQMRAG